MKGAIQLSKKIYVSILMMILLITGCNSNTNQHNATEPKMQTVPEQSNVRNLDQGRGNIRVLNTEVDNYYRNAVGKTGAELKQILHEIISQQDVIDYRGQQMWDALGDTDQDPNDPSKVMLLYAGRSVLKSAHGSQWNKEHVWAQYHGEFGRTRGIGSDLHNLKPEDITVNQDRGHKNFDESDNDYDENRAPDTEWDTDSWEPRDEVKGDVARIILYMDTRYEDTDRMDLKVVDSSPMDNSEPQHGKLSTLLKWHEEDPVDDFERRRNNVIFEKYQHNRNPFIDHPEWVAEVYK